MLRQALPCIQGCHACCPGGVHSHGREASWAHHPSHACRAHTSRDAGPPGTSMLQELTVKGLPRPHLGREKEECPGPVHDGPVTPPTPMGGAPGTHCAILAQLLALLLLQRSHGGCGCGRGRGRSCSHSSSCSRLCEVSGGPASMGREAQAPCTTCIPARHTGQPCSPQDPQSLLYHLGWQGSREATSDVSPAGLTRC